MPRKKVSRARSKNWMWVGAAAIAAGLAVTAVAYWQYAFEPLPSTARQLTIAAPPAVSPVSPAASAQDEPAPARPAPITKAPATKAPARVAVRRDAPPAATASAPAPAPARATRNDPPAAAPVERRASVPAAVPVATFMIIHDHSRGNFETDDPKATCQGELTIFENELRFEPRDGGDRFAASWADVKDVGGNRFFGSGKGGFHVAVNVAGKYKNFNLAPQSKEKAEAKQILDLLNSYTRRSDRTK